MVEHFYSLQGEGYWSGKPAYFLRLGGCDVGCSWCDTKYSWAMHGWQDYPIEEILSQVGSVPARHVVLTGGEPTLHSLSPLIETLQQAGYFVQIETSGAYPPPERLPDWITFSPKRFKPPHPAWYAIAHELKVVIHARSDFRWAEKQYALCTGAPVAFLQPDSYRPEAPQWIIEYLRTHPHWRMSLQIHKYLSIP
ncbi:MAG: 7-carboxy-7-deazaguanine synthase QueE [Bacteroidia bacterium]|nr:7-carboxy-7-deazaguanine synthase QueE [Bacteroidia bacterium]